MDNDIRGRYRGYQSRRPAAAPGQRPKRPQTPPQHHQTPNQSSRQYDEGKQIGQFQQSGSTQESQAAHRTASQQTNNSQPADQAISQNPMDGMADIYRNHAKKQHAYYQQKKSKKPILAILFILLFLAGVGYGSYWYITRDKSGAEVTNSSQDNNGSSLLSTTQQSSPGAPAAKKTVRLVATGDMIAHDTVNEQAKKPDGSYDYAKHMKAMEPFFDKADIGFCNQATPAGGAQFGITGYPVFNAPIAFARGIESVGCNVINIGTNHTNDKGQPLVDATVAAWDDREVLAVSGANRSQAEQDSIEYFTQDGIKFAFLSYSTYSNKPVENGFGINMYTEDLAEKQTTAARKEADMVVVSMRWGTEYSPDITAQQEAIATNLANYGADIVLGHGPHVLEPVKKIKAADGHEAVVWFSLGNFLNTQLDVESLIGGFAVMDIEVATKTVSNVAFMPVYMHYEWSSADKAAQNLLARKNLQMAPLDKSADLLAKSQLNTTVEAQTNRVRDVLNKHTKVPIITSAEF